jgi:hypothetical protein
MAEKTFEPSEAELREALAKVKQRFEIYVSWLGQWLEVLERADEIVFTFDRPTWDEHYRDLGGSIAAAMLNQLVYEDAPYTDDDDVDHPGSPHWQALNGQSAALPKPEQTSGVAACAKAPAKRTHKLKRGKRRARDGEPQAD